MQILWGLSAHWILCNYYSKSILRVTYCKKSWNNVIGVLNSEDRSIRRLRNVGNFSTHIKRLQSLSMLKFVRGERYAVTIGVLKRKIFRQQLMLEDWPKHIVSCSQSLFLFLLALYVRKEWTLWQNNERVTNFGVFHMRTCILVILCMCVRNFSLIVINRNNYGCLSESHFVFIHSQIPRLEPQIPFKNCILCCRSLVSRYLKREHPSLWGKWSRNSKLMILLVIFLFVWTKRNRWEYFRFLVQ